MSRLHASILSIQSEVVPPTIEFPVRVKNFILSSDASWNPHVRVDFVPLNLFTEVREGLPGVGDLESGTNRTMPLLFAD